MIKIVEGIADSEVEVVTSYKEMDVPGFGECLVIVSEDRDMLLLLVRINSRWSWVDMDSFEDEGTYNSFTEAMEFIEQEDSVYLCYEASDFRELLSEIYD